MGLNQLPVSCQSSNGYNFAPLACNFRDTLKVFSFVVVVFYCCLLYSAHIKVSPHSSLSIVVLQEVLSAAIIIKLLSCCQLPERCSKGLWLFAPQIISTMVVRKANTTRNQTYTNLFFLGTCRVLLMFCHPPLLQIHPTPTDLRTAFIFVWA